MLKIGITGENSFIGYHLKTHIKYKTSHQIVSFKDSFFEDKNKILSFAKECDVIVHLAGVNRAEKEDYIYSRNVELAKILIEALKGLDKLPYLIFSSSTQEGNGSSYAKGKQEARELLANFYSSRNADFSGLIIPNVFGAFGRPDYNSVVATFTHRVATGGKGPQVINDKNLKLISVEKLCEDIIDIISKRKTIAYLPLEHEFDVKVSEILNRLLKIKKSYLEDNIILDLNDSLGKKLFNMFITYLNDEDRIITAPVHTDERGYLFECVKVKSGGQSFFSKSTPGITRGKHFHFRKFERFTVISGEALIRLRKIGSDKVSEYRIKGGEGKSIDMPIYHTHDIRNTGKDDLLVLFWSNEIFNPDDSDTFYEEV